MIHISHEVQHTNTKKKEEAGSNLLSHWAAPAVPSAFQGLTSVFGMGTGGTLETIATGQNIKNENGTLAQLQK